MYDIHPSPELQKLFLQKPYQGQEREKAKIIIFGIDANYHKDLRKGCPGFDLIEEYHDNGVGFWLNEKHEDINGNRVHHPFLDLKYPSKKLRDGVRYHKRFAQMGLSPEICASCISFVELLNVPTFGRMETKEDRLKFWELFEEYRAIDQIKSIDHTIINNGDGRLVLLCDTVIRRMNEIKTKYWNEDIFNWLPKNTKEFSKGDQKKEIRITKIAKVQSSDIYKIIHFSYASNLELQEIKKLIESYCCSTIH